MSVHLDREIENLKKKILFLGAEVEEHLQRAVNAVRRRDSVEAETIIQGDEEIDEREIEVEEDCLKILALHQPVARDLRYIVSILKINNDLERIGDLAENIAERATNLAGNPEILIPDNLGAIAERTIAMLSKSLDAFVNLDSDLGRQVCDEDDAVDALNREMFDLVKERMRGNPERIDGLMHILSVSRYLERVADHATNIAEDVVYMIEGDIIRHAH